MKNFKELLNQISEDTTPMAKAIFVVGVPGSGKDVIIRSIINEFSILELNHNQAYSILYSNRLIESSTDYKTAAIRNHSPIIIAAPATDIDSVLYIKEGLENRGYKTSMVFVNTTNEISIDRNGMLSKSMTESIRYDKWCCAQENLDIYTEIFEDIIIVDNIGTLTNINECIEDVCHKTKLFLERTCKPTKQDISKFTNGKTGRDTKHSNLLSDNNCPTCQLVRISGKQDDVRYGDVAQNTGYSNRAYHEQTQPTIKIIPQKKIPKFRQDKDALKNKYTSSGKDIPGKRIGDTGVGPTWSDRPNQGSGAFGNVQVENKSFAAFRKEIIEGIEAGSGGLGTVPDASAKEPMDTLHDKALRLSPPRIKKKKVG